MPRVRQVCHVAFVTVTDDFMSLVADEGVDALHHVLKCPGIVDRKPGADQRKQQQQQHKDHNCMAT